jgi:hypothetical protein
MDADDCVIAHHRNAVGGFDRLLYVACGDEGGSVPLAGANGVDEIAPRADIDALKGLVGQEKTTRRGLPTANHYLLLIAA